jgi:hypothetical protein
MSGILNLLDRAFITSENEEKILIFNKVKANVVRTVRICKGDPANDVLVMALAPQPAGERFLFDVVPPTDTLMRDSYPYFSRKCRDGSCNIL